jgi:hypothetical protein
MLLTDEEKTLRTNPGEMGAQDGKICTEVEHVEI